MQTIYKQYVHATTDHIPLARACARGVITFEISEVCGILHALFFIGVYGPLCVQGFCMLSSL